MPLAQVVSVKAQRSVTSDVMAAATPGLQIVHYAVGVIRARKRCGPSRVQFAAAKWRRAEVS